MENRDRTIPVAIIVGVIALLLGLCCGLTAGVAGGYLIGHRAAPRALETIRIPTQEPIAPIAPQIPMVPEPGASGTMNGALIREVIAGSPAEEAGIKVGDILTQVDDTPIDENHRLADVIGQYKPGQRVDVTVWRVGDTVTLKVTLGANEQDPKRPYLGVRYSDFSMMEDQEPKQGE